MNARARVLLVLVAFVLGCRSRPGYVPNPGPYDRIPERWQDTLARARDAFEEGALDLCHALLVPLAEEEPSILPVRVLLQDAELGLLGAGREVGGVSVPPGDARAHLADIYVQRADANPSAERYVLAARLQSEVDVALEYLAQAEELDPGCVWVHYARAWWLFGARRFPEARESIARAFEIDPGHMPTMRLQASMLASGGDTREAIDCLTAWLERGENDPLIDPRQRADAQVDLAALLVLDREPADAIELLARIRRDLLPDKARAELVRAAALEDLGLRTLALSAARRAKGLDPDGLLPLVQQALLLRFEGNTATERDVWQTVVDEAEAAWERPASGAQVSDASPLDFGALLIQLQANARIERIDAQRERRKDQP